MSATTESQADRRAALWETLREVSRPLVLYWIFLGLMFGAFCFAALLENPDSEGVYILATFGIVTFGSVLIGQLMAFLRVRDWIVFAYWWLTWTLGLGIGIFSMAIAGPLAILIFVWVMFSPMFTLGGLWSLRVNRALFASWVPLIYATGTAIIMAERDGKVDTWRQGAKWAVWDVFTFSVLGLAIALLLAYLVTRETHRLHRWRRSPRAPLRGSVRESGRARPRLSCLGWVLIGMLAMGLAVGTAILGPYLWRTGPGDGGGEGGEPTEQTDAPQEPTQQKPQDGDLRDRLREQADTVVEQVQQDMGERMERSVNTLSTLLLLLLLFLGALLVFGRPARRLLMVRHCRAPFWEVSATTRIEQGWRLVEIAMSDVGVPPRAGEPAESLYRRALPVLNQISGGAREVHGLEAAAQTRDRVAYGLGVSPGEVEHMNRVASWAFDTVWERLGDWEQIKALYRRI